MNIHEIETPALLVDLDVFKSNLKKMANYCRKHGLQLRPHTKTHKCPEIAKLQVAQGFPGITCAKVGEAEVMVEHGLKDILIAYPIVGASKIKRLCALAKKANIAVALDSIEVAEGIAREAARKGITIDILTEIDVGLNRVGVATAAELLTLAQKVDRLKGLRLRGISCYPGQLFCKASEQRASLEEMSQKILSARDLFVRKGLNESWVSGGSSPTAYQSHQMKGITEIRPGMYPFNDRNLLEIKVCTPDECALHVLTTVVSTSVKHRAMVDGGSKTFSSDRFIPAGPDAKPTFGLIREDPRIIFDSMSEEHGHLNVRKAKAPLKIGQRLRILPNHVCPVVNLNEKLVLFRGEKVIDFWEVKGRGKIQ